VERGGGGGCRRSFAVFCGLHRVVEIERRDSGYGGGPGGFVAGLARCPLVSLVQAQARCTGACLEA
jgi:hypothetical protein